MASQKEQNVPVWDGSARSWRRYTREVCWYVRATAVEKRRYCATKLVSRLKGPARLLAMSWTTMEFDHVNGVRDLLQRLATSPLVRQILPNAAATCQQYFNFRRDAGEQMNTFLVREALGYSEFVEALLLLYEDKQGVQQHEKNFDLPEELPRDDWQDWWHDATDENLMLLLHHRRDLQALLLRLLHQRGLLRLLLEVMALECLLRGNHHVLQASALWEFLVLRCHLASRPPTSTSSAWRTVSSLGCYVVFVFYKLLV